MSRRVAGFGTMVVMLALAGLTGCTPAVQAPSSSTTSTAVTVTAKNVSWTPLTKAVNKSTAASMYKLESDVELKNGSMHTSYTVYGTVNLPDRASISVHENNFNISFYQQGKVAYADETSSWTQTDPIQDLRSFNSYAQLVQTAAGKHLTLEKLNRTFVVDEYCDVYRFTMPNQSVQLPGFLQQVAGNNRSTLGSNEPIQYTFYVGQTTGFVREVQTDSINPVDQLGPVVTDTSTTFFDIDEPKVAAVKIPQTLVKQLEGSAQQ
ncbi:hypothetical protein AAC03nite_05510 [Alicyclobacillus acidoterrestris]|uniref:hypothetical protein n=1 Tax=Alicyclobacillus suci TaxID=2816080 RepID=UPI001193D3CD|nr:hypothetical protein [Alicyclobacillus suci]GEO24766.1 hypothetical protein AAC03nite_05510 [Alicyclobacillus acidoterrestris]